MMLQYSGQQDRRVGTLLCMVTLCMRGKPLFDSLVSEVHEVGNIKYMLFPCLVFEFEFKPG